MVSLVKSYAMFLLDDPQVKKFENWILLGCAEETFSYVDVENVEGTRLALEEHEVISRYH